MDGSRVLDLDDLLAQVESSATVIPQQTSALDALLAQVEGGPAAQDAWAKRKWYTGRFWPDKEVSIGEWGPAGFMIAARGVADPQRSERGTYGTLDWRKTMARPVSFWRPRFLNALEDGEPRTFNRLLVEIANVTGDMGGTTSAEWALWGLVEEGLVAHTIKPADGDQAIYFVVLDGPFGGFPWQWE